MKTPLIIRFFSIATCILWGAVCIYAQQDSSLVNQKSVATAAVKKINEDISLADEKVAAYDYDEAIRLIQQAYSNAYANKGAIENTYGYLLFSPDTLLIKVAKIYLMENKLEQASNEIDGYISLNPKKLNLDVLLLKAYVNYQMQNFYEAIPTYTEILEKPSLSDSLRFSCLFRRGICSYNVENIQEAYLDFIECNRIYPKRYEPYYNMGRCLFRSTVTRENLLKAIHYFDEVIRRDSLHVQSLFLRGRSYERLRKYELALKDFSACIEVDPENQDAYYKKAYMLFYLNRSKVKPSICEEFFKAVRLGSGDALRFYEENCKVKNDSRQE